eukprot:6211387-Pleurochrysis_carterae.AAC.1
METADWCSRAWGALVPNCLSRFRLQRASCVARLDCVNAPYLVICTVKETSRPVTSSQTVLSRRFLPAHLPRQPM